MFNCRNWNVERTGKEKKRKPEKRRKPNVYGKKISFIPFQVIIFMSIMKLNEKPLKGAFLAMLSYGIRKRVKSLTKCCVTLSRLVAFADFL